MILEFSAKNTRAIKNIIPLLPEFNQMQNACWKFQIELFQNESVGFENHAWAQID